MESLKEKLKNKTFSKAKNFGKVQEWQEIALKICEEFGIENVIEVYEDKNGKQRIQTRNYKAIVFRHACNNLSFLIGKVEYCREKFNGDVYGKGKYLFSLFRKQKPWEK
jgi:hypothetical protein